MSVTLWDDLVHSNKNMQLYDKVNIKNLKLIVDSSKYNWGTSQFIDSVSQRHGSEIKIVKSIFHYSKLEFKKLNDLSIYSNNYKGKLIKIIDEANTYKFWKSENTIHEILKLKRINFMPSLVYEVQ